MRYHLKAKTAHSNQSGMISIMVTIILMAVITLIVLGFSQQSRREARQTLDRQLSTQAFYAAESGINTAQKVIKSLRDTGGSLDSIIKTNCANNQLPYSNYSNVISTNPSVSYTCLTVNTTVSTLSYDLSTSGGSKVSALHGVNVNTGVDRVIRSLKVIWQSKKGVANPLTGCTNGTSLPPASSWGCGYGIIRLDLVPMNGAMSRNNMMKNTFTAFFRPASSGSGTINYSGGSNLYSGTANQGALAAARCIHNSGTDECSMVIRNLNYSQYVMRIMTMYQDASVQVLAFGSNNGSGDQLNLADGQAVIDSTGQAGDVIRRVQVRIPISKYGGDLYSDFALNSNTSIDKTKCYYSGSAIVQSGCY